VKHHLVTAASLAWRHLAEMTSIKYGWRHIKAENQREANQAEEYHAAMKYLLSFGLSVRQKSTSFENWRN